MEDGETVSAKNICTLGGELSYRADSRLKEGVIKAEIHYTGLAEGKHPETITIRLPHPIEGTKAKQCVGGTYCAETESVTVHLNGKLTLDAEIELFF